jgi:hypothetical protein
MFIKFHVLFINRHTGLPLSAVQDAGDTGITCLTVEKECEPGLYLGVSSRPPGPRGGQTKSEDVSTFVLRAIKSRFIFLDIIEI